MINLLGKVLSFFPHAQEMDMFDSLLEKYFEMNKKQCRESLDIYKKFIERTDRVSQYLKIAEVIVKFIFELFKEKESISFMNTFLDGPFMER